MTQKAFENRLNILLSELLNELGISSYSEQIEYRGRKDIIIYYLGFQIIIEGSYNKLDAERDAIRRLEQSSGNLAIALHYTKEYPQNVTESELKEMIKESQFEVKVLVPIDLSQLLLQYLTEKKIIVTQTQEWINVNIQLLCNIIKESAQFIVNEMYIKILIDKFEELVNNFVNFLVNHTNSNTIAENIHKILFKLYDFSIGNSFEIKDVIFAQACLAIILSAVYYQMIRFLFNFESLKIISKNESKLTALQIAVSNILKKSYKHIFEITYDILNSLPAMDDILAKLIDLSCEIAEKKSLLRQDFAGKLYHKIVGNWSIKKNLATYYTQISIAYLLAYLANPQIKLDANNNINFPLVCDFACGSGTLISATYSVLKNNYQSLLMKLDIEKIQESNEDKFHNLFIQNCFGFDVLRYATQITTLNLAFHNPESSKKDFKIYTLPLGSRKDNGQTISLGSLEFARRQLLLKQILFGNEVEKIDFSESEKELLNFHSAKFDFICMNPPFTRAGGRRKKQSGEKGGGLFGFIANTRIRNEILDQFNRLRKEISQDLSNKTKNFLESDLVKILSKPGLKTYLNIGQAGEGLLFIYLARKYIKEGGTIAFVLPKNLLSGTSWLSARVLLASDFIVKYIVISNDNERGFNFSESTGLSECLIIAELKSSHIHTNESNITEFIILLQKPSSSISAIALASQLRIQQLRRPLEYRYVKGIDTLALTFSVNQDQLKENIINWGRFVSLPNPKLINFALNIINGLIKLDDTKMIPFPMTILEGIIASIGIDSKQFSLDFQKIDKPIANSFKAYIGGSEEKRTNIFIKPNTYVLPKSKNGNKLFNEKSGKLLLPSAIPPAITHTIAQFCDEDVISYLMYIIKLKDNDVNKLKALCLWLNTTFGIITVLANRQEVSGNWIQLTMAQWRMLQILDVTKLSSQVIDKMAKALDTFRNIDLGRLPEQFDTSNKTYEKRLKLDKLFLESMGMDLTGIDELLKGLYNEIYQAIKQLTK